MRRYTPYKKPKAREWLHLSEERRISLVEKAHQEEGYDLESLTAHAGVHVAVENQLAENIPEVVDAYERLRKEGLDRHDCIHAIGSAMIEHVFENGASGEDGYFQKLGALTARSWLEQFDDA